ncbi:hypothetical protein KRP22_002276 [Phytophthora ramorum]|nr:hypothetical protein KRP22_1559 [Phytophthora ramorum]
MASASSARCPPLCRRNALWWSQTYGHNEDARQRPEAAAVAPSGRDGFYRAIRDNCVDQVQRFVAENPAAVFTKIFGNNQWTALYVASFFGRHQIVRVLLRHGADKNVQCDGMRPVDVAGFGSTNSVDRMKVRALLQGDACPRVVIRLDDSKGSSTAGSKTRRLQIHFSEAVDDFTLEDIEASDGCEVVAFSMLRQDLFLVTVQLVRGNSASVEVPAGAARSAGGRCNAGSGPFQLQVSSPQ